MLDVAFRNVRGDDHELVSNRGLDLVHLHRQLLHRHGISLRRKRQLRNEFGRFDEVRVCGFTHERSDGFGNQICSDVIELQKDIHRTGDLCDTGRTAVSLAVEDTDTSPFQLSAHQRAFVATSTIVDVEFIAPIDEFGLTDRPRTVAALEDKGGQSFDGDIGYPHDVPDIDQDFRVANEKGEHLGIGVDRLRWHATKNARIF